MTEERKYIYSIIRNLEETQSSDSFRLSEATLGINNRDIILVPYRDIAAAVSNTHLINFDKLDKKELTHLVAMHEQVNSDLMKKHDVIPMRFGMVAENIEEIRNILTKAYLQFKTVLERIAGKAEFVIQVFWNEKNMLEKIAGENAEIQKLKKEAESKGRIWGLKARWARPYLGFSSKMKLGRAIFEALESRRKEYIKDILGNLTISFPDFSAGPLRPRSGSFPPRLGEAGSEASPLRQSYSPLRRIEGEASEASKLLDTNKKEGVNPEPDQVPMESRILDKVGTRYGASKEMIMNYSFLIGKTEEPVLEFQLNKLAEKYSASARGARLPPACRRGRDGQGSASGGKDELKFKYIGPMAPYSFAVINLGVGNFDLVDNARRALGLGESAAMLAIRDAYRKLAAEHHPDKHEYKKDQVILEEAARKMKNIVAANEVLSVYCKHYLSALAPEKEQLCSFKKEDVENSIIIKEK